MRRRTRERNPPSACHSAATVAASRSSLAISRAVLPARCPSRAVSSSRSGTLRRAAFGGKRSDRPEVGQPSKTHLEVEPHRQAQLDPAGGIERIPIGDPHLQRPLALLDLQDHRPVSKAKSAETALGTPSQAPTVPEPPRPERPPASGPRTRTAMTGRPRSPGPPTQAVPTRPLPDRLRSAPSTETAPFRPAPSSPSSARPRYSPDCAAGTARRAHPRCCSSFASSPSSGDSAHPGRSRAHDTDTVVGEKDRHPPAALARARGESPDHSLQAHGPDRIRSCPAVTTAR